MLEPRPTEFQNLQPSLGARVAAAGVQFGAYVTTAEHCFVRLFDEHANPLSTHPMRPVVDGVEGAHGYFQLELPDVKAGSHYKFVLDDRELPDPWARFLPFGVDGPAMVVDDAFPWRSPLRPVPSTSDRIIYELHVGTFSPEGTYAGASARIPHLLALGVTVVELMPVAAFAGARGWGYDGVAWFAPFAPYGTPSDLRSFIDRLHGAGLSVMLDVVYNHFGPHGNYLRSFSPSYFSARAKNAWGESLDYGHPVVRRMILENARYWLNDFRFDGLRLDATHAIFDDSPEHVLRTLSREVDQMQPDRVLIAEDDRNDRDCILSQCIDALWADDFHHAVRVTVTGEQEGYFAAYPPAPATIAETINNGWFYCGQTYPLTGRARGTPTFGIEAHGFVYCIQNHDQVGNRALGERISTAISPDMYRAISTLLLFLPMTPLIFMGQEWAATSPFLFFTDHDDELGKLIVAGRREEFKSFSAFADPEIRRHIPNPQDTSTFELSHLDWSECERDECARTLELYRAMIALRKHDQVLATVQREGLVAEVRGDVLWVRRSCQAGERVLAVNFGRDLASPDGAAPVLADRRLILSSDGACDDREALPPETALLWAHLV